MKRILYLDTFSGISGDMLLGALVDAGLAPEDLTEGLKGLDLDGYEIHTETTYRGAFRATRLRVLTPEMAPGNATADSDSTGSAPAKRPPSEKSHSPDSPPSPDSSRETGDSHHHHHDHDPTHDAHHHSHHHHGHQHSHSHAHSHSHSGAHSRTSSPAPPPGARAPREGRFSQHWRTLREIRELIDDSRLSASVRARSREVFEKLGAAEARAHGIPIDEVHFHEVGAVDSIVDICGACLALELMGIDAVHAAPPVLGSGFTTGAHGKFPLPAPATIEVLRGCPTVQRDVPFELTTPTGAALVATLAERFGPLPPLRVLEVGHGAGNDRPTEIPNFLRVIIGEAAEEPGAATRDQVVSLETHLDDVSPQWIAHLGEELLEAGALDVTVTPVLMKKGRPGHHLTVLAPPEREGELADRIFAEVPTLGLRRQRLERLVLPRRFETVSTPHGEVRIKISEHRGQISSAVPEYEDLRRLARAAGISLREAHRLALEAHRQER